MQSWEFREALLRCSSFKILKVKSWVCEAWRGPLKLHGSFVRVYRHPLWWNVETKSNEVSRGQTTRDLSQVKGPKAKNKMSWDYRGRIDQTH